MKDELGREKKDWHTPAQTSRPVGRHAHLLELLHPASDMRSSTIAITVLCLISVTVSPISESWRCSARLRIPPRERRRLSSAYAQSLGELAKKEKERREKVTDESKVVTNDDLSKFKHAPITTGVLPPRPAEQKPAIETTGVEAKSAAAGAAKENP